MCLSYLRGLVSRLREYEEDRVMPHIRSAGTLASLAAMLHINHGYLGRKTLAIGAEALAHLCGTEHFGTYRVRRSQAVSRTAGSRSVDGWGVCARLRYRCCRPGGGEPLLSSLPR